MTIDLAAMRMLENRRNLQVTILHRPGGAWSQEEVSRLVNGLHTEVQYLGSRPEYLLVWGHYTKGQTLEAIMGGVAYATTQVTGVDKLPWFPSGWVL